MALIWVQLTYFEPVLVFKRQVAAWAAKSAEAVVFCDTK